MYGYRIILTKLMSLIVLSIGFPKLMNTTVLTCSSDFRSSIVPLKPPKTNVGSFMVYQNFNAILFQIPIRDVYIYWQEIDEKNICGGSLEYQVFCTPDNTDIENFNKTIMKKTYSNYVKFEELSTTLEYKCEIYSMNDNVLSSEYSTVDIPLEWDRDLKTLSLTRMEFNEKDIIELSWSPPQISFHQIINYTLFWCEMDINQPYECIGSLKWVNISSLYTSYNVTVDDKKKNYRFSISVNSEIYLQDQFDGYDEVIYRSSGMILESCTLQSNNLPGKISNIEINVIASRYIQMFWVLDCSERVGTIKGYRVLYCSIDQNSQCVGPLIEKIIYPKNLPYAKILNYERITVLAIAKLQPSTSYKFTISLLTNNGEGIASNDLFVTTLKEGEYSNTGSSVVVWKAP